MKHLRHEYGKRKCVFCSSDLRMISVSGFSYPKFETCCISMYPIINSCIYILKLYFPIFLTAATTKGFRCTRTAAVLFIRAQIFVVLLHAVTPPRSCTGTVERETRFGFTKTEKKLEMAHYICKVSSSILVGRFLKLKYFLNQ